MTHAEIMRLDRPALKALALGPCICAIDRIGTRPVCDRCLAIEEITARLDASTARVLAADSALADECAAVAKWWGRFADVVRKGAAAGAASLEVLAAANGIPLPPGVLGEATKAAAERVLDAARGKVAGA